MFNYFSDVILNYIADNTFLLAVSALIGLSKFFLIFSQFCFFFLIPTLVSIFLGIVFFKPNSPFYWKKFKKDPAKTLKKCYEHELFRFAAKMTINLVSILMLILALLLMALVLTPQEGMHVRDQFTNQNIVLAMGYFSIFAIMIIYLKAAFYNCAGFIKSFGEFNLKMIIW